MAPAPGVAPAHPTSPIDIDASNVNSNNMAFMSIS
jgi:hypothetical protein